MFKKFLVFFMVLMMLLTLSIPSVFAEEYYNPMENDSPKMLHNNPFTYSYEYDPLLLTASRHFTQAEANDNSKWLDVLAIGLGATKYGIPLALLIEISAKIEGTYNQPGTLKVWSGEKREIATSTLTGSSHVTNTWLQYRIMFIGDDGSVLRDYSGSVHLR